MYLDIDRDKSSQLLNSFYCRLFFLCLCIWRGTILGFLRFCITYQKQLAEAFELVDLEVVVYVAQYSHVILHLLEPGPKDILCEVYHAVRCEELIVVC